MTVETRELLERVLPLGAIAVVFVLGALALSPFAPALLWSVFVSVALYPLHKGLSRRLGGSREIATIFTAIGLIVLVLLPMLLDLSRFRAAPSARLSHLPFESDRAFPAQC